MATWLIVLVLIILTILAKKPGLLKGKSSTLSPTSPPSISATSTVRATERTTPTIARWKTVVWIIGAVVAVGIGLVWVFPGLRNEKKPGPSSSIATHSTVLVPAEIALPIICGCESSGKPGVLQRYEPGSTTELLKNRQGSSARGECQIKFDLHLKEAKDKYGLDLMVEKDYWEYAKILYNQTPHTKHWEGTPGNTTKGCWAPILESISTDKLGYIVVQGPVGRFSEVQKLDPTEKAFFYEHGKKCTVLWNGTIEEDFPREKGVESKTPKITWFFQVKSRESVPVPVTVLIKKNL